MIYHQSSPQPVAVYVTVEDAVNPVPRTAVCGKEGFTRPIPRSPVRILPEGTPVEKVFFHKVIRDTLPGGARKVDIDGSRLGPGREQPEARR